MQLIENKLISFVNSNPEAVKLVSEATKNRDITIRIEDKEHPFGAHWEKDSNSVSIFISGVNFNQLSNDNLAQLLDADLQEDHSSLYAVIFELCNSVNGPLNNAESYIEFENKETYAKYMESLEYGSYQRACGIYQYGHEHCGWRSIKPRDLNDFETYYQQTLASDEGAKHVKYYSDSYVDIVNAVNTCITSLLTDMQNSMDAFKQSMKKYNDKFDGYPQRAQQALAAVNNAYSDPVLNNIPKLVLDNLKFELHHQTRSDFFALELYSLTSERSSVEFAYRTALQSIGFIKSVALETLREGSIPHRKYKRDLIAMFDGLEKQVHDQFTAFNKTHTDNLNTLHTNQKDLDRIDRSALKGSKQALEDQVQAQINAFDDLVTQTQRHEKERTEMSRPLFDSLNTFFAKFGQSLKPEVQANIKQADTHNPDGQGPTN